MKRIAQIKNDNSDINEGMDYIYKKYCSGRKTTKKEREKILNKMAQITKKTGRTLTQEVIDLRRGRD